MFVLFFVFMFVYFHSFMFVYFLPYCLWIVSNPFNSPGTPIDKGPTKQTNKQTNKHEWMNLIKHEYTKNKHEWTEK